MTTLRSGVSARISGVRPSTEFGSTAKLFLGPSSYAFIQFGLPKDLRKGAVVLSATLRITQSTTLASTRTNDIRKVADRWLVSKINYTNRPTATGTTRTVTQAGSVTTWTYTVTEDVQQWVDGVLPNYGWRVGTDDPTGFYVYGFAASTGKPTLDVTYVYPPAVPTSLHPSAGAVSIAKPVLRFDAGDIAALQVQIDPAANATTPAYDSGWVNNTEAEFDTAAPPSPAPAYAGLALNGSTQWRARVRNDANLESSWSQWVTFSRVAKQVLTITQPTGIVLESTPPILWTMPNMVQWRVRVAKASDPTIYIHDSGMRAGTTGVYTPPKPVFVKDGQNYVITVSGWDAVDREFTRGDPTQSSDSETVVLDDDPGIVGVTYLSAQQKSFAPWVDLIWSRVAMPDGWVVWRDGVRIYDTSTPGDLNASGTIYTFRDWTATPNREHVYKVAPVENGVTARTTLTDTVTPEIKGVWLGDPESGRDVMLFGTDDPEATYGEEADTFAGIGATSTIDVVTALRGMEGSASGLLVSALDRVSTDDADTLLAFKSEPALELRMSWAAVNIPVTIRNVQPVPRRLGTNPSEVTYNASFSFKQTGELPFEADL